MPVSIWILWYHRIITRDVGVMVEDEAGEKPP